MSDKWLLIDDVRTFNVDFIARTALEGKKALLTKRYGHLILDHDLGDLDTGYDIICWAKTHNCLPNHIQLVSMNPPGLKAMKVKLLDLGYISNGGCDFIRNKNKDELI